MHYTKVFATLVILLDFAISKSVEEYKRVENPDYWMKLGEDELERNLKKTPNKNKAKNIILLIGDGMGVPTITAARHLKETLKGQPHLFFEENMPFTSSSKTYCVDSQTPDSACTASALYSGIKTNYGTFGYDSQAERKKEKSVSSANEISTILNWAQEAGKATGFVTTARLTHATPAALYAHSVERDYECDGEIPEEGNAKDIAWQLVHQRPGKGVKVMLGGGRAAFQTLDYKDPVDGWNCSRRDEANLIEQWMLQKGQSGLFVEDIRQLRQIDPDQVDFLLGIFSPSHLPFIDQRDPEIHPDLKEMTEKAIDVLIREPQGFFLMVEAARIDQGHHENWASRALLETLELDEAVEAVFKRVDLEETLIIVTADHSHTMSLSGYADRGSDIRGLGTKLADDGLPHSILSYANGPSFYDQYYADQNGTILRKDPRLLEGLIFEPNYAFPSAVYKGDESHGGEDVMVYAQGPWAHLFQSVHEQTYIAYVMAFAACVGPLKDQCEGGRGGNLPQHDLADEIINEGGHVEQVFIRGIRTVPSIWFFLFLGCLLGIFYCTTTGKAKRNRDEYSHV